MTQTSISGTTGIDVRPVPAVQISGVTKDFGDVHAVRGPDAGNFCHRRCFDFGAHRQSLEDKIDLQAWRRRDQHEQA